MQNDRLRDFLKFFRFHLSWFILSAGFFAVILVSGIFLSTKYVVDTATETAELNQPTATPEQLELSTQMDTLSEVATPSAIPIPSPIATLEAVATPEPVPSIMPIPEPTPTSSPLISSVVEQPKTSVDSYIVKPGDTLWSIAQSKYNNGHLFSRISHENNLKNANLIQVGQTLTIPQLTEAEKNNPTQKGTITDSAWSDDKTVYKQYTIVEGDSLWNIAERELGDPYRWMEIHQANSSVIGTNPDLIYPNVTLRIPTDSQPVSATPQTFNWTSSLLQ